MQAGPVRDAHPAWDPFVPRGQQPPGARRESRTGPVRCGRRDPRGNRLGVLAGSLHFTFLFIPSPHFRPLLFSIPSPSGHSIPLFSPFSFSLSTFLLLEVGPLNPSYGSGTALYAPPAKSEVKTSDGLIAATDKNYHASTNNYDWFAASLIIATAGGHCHRE